MSSPIELLQEQMQRANTLMQLPTYSPQYKIWSDTTIRILRDNFNNEYVEIFRSIRTKGVVRRSAPGEVRKSFINMVSEKMQLLQVIIDESSRLQSEPTIDISRSLPLQAYEWQKEIKDVSLKLYEDKHYSQAIEEAFKRVVQEVKRIYEEKTGQAAVDGDSLMNKAFSCANQTPVIAFNQLRTQGDRDEQQGMMNLFKGIVGIRNKKAHMNVTLNDPVRATEYLSLASLLMRLLDQFAI
jgi:uncharacterized protein (TIGR02391 family)